MVRPLLLVLAAALLASPALGDAAAAPAVGSEGSSIPTGSPEGSVPAGSEGSASPALLTRDEAKKLKIKELREALASRGRSCSGCSEKADYVDMFMEVQHLPTRTPTPPPTPPPYDSAEIEELMRKMKGRQNKGSARIQRVRKTMEARGYDTSGLDGMDLTSFADFTTDE